MTYVYDLLLNFNPKLYEFYEWEKDDKLSHIKRIYLIKISSIAYNDLLDKNIKLNDDFLLNIFNKTEYFENRNVKTIPYAILITDTYRVMGITFDMNGEITKYSSLLLDEEEDILEISDRLATIKLDYQILSKKEKNNELTRRESHILHYIKDDLDKSLKENDVSKLKYLYYEYFNQQGRDVNTIYHSLVNELHSVNEKHIRLYELIRLSYSHKNV